MANAIKGEIAVVAPDGPMLGDYILLLDFNALCELEEEFPGIMDGQVAFTGFKSIRRLFHQGFAYHHPEMSEVEAGHIIQSVGLAEASAKLGEAMKASFPEAKGDGPKAQKGRASPGAGTAR